MAEAVAEGTEAATAGVRITMVAQPGPLIAALGPVLTATVNPLDLPREVGAAAALVAGTGADVLVLTDDVPTQRALELAAEVGRVNPEIDVAWLVAPHPTLLTAAMEAGIRRLIDPTEHDVAVRSTLVELGRAAMLRRQRLAGAAATPSGDTSRRHGRLVAVIGAKGGVGKTTVAVNLAALLARQQPRQVAVVDMDLAAGDVDFVLGLDSGPSLAEVARSGSVVDAPSVKLALSAHPTGLLVLPAPGSLADADDIDTNLLAPVLTALRSSFSVVVVDTPPGAGAEVAAAAEVADDLLLVATPDLGGLRSLRRVLDALDELDLTSAQRHLVLNRADHRTGLTAQAIEAAVEVPISHTIPDQREVAQAANQRIPLVATTTRSEAQKAFVDLARRFDPHGADDGGARVGTVPGRGTPSGGRSPWNV